MPSPTPPGKPPRGRPPTITAERIAAAGKQITLPRITIVGMASALGVSHIALYKHVPSLEALKQQVAEAIFEDWQAPPLAQPRVQPLADYLAAFSRSLRKLVDHNPGLVPYLVQRGTKSARMVERIAAHHGEVAEAYRLPPAQARWLLSTVASHCVALADTVYSRQPDRPGLAASGFERSMQALIIGALALLAEDGPLA